ncbi:MAG: dicarboxylate/amino acid:cation symporter [Gemmatimonadetes bacterium]|nr:dicarboxylate/amino acid:cation symporter [Gemmatimonadota bacterium]
MALAAWSPRAAATLGTVLEPIGTLWINAVRMTVIPLVVALIFTGVAGAGDPSRLGKMGARAVPIFLVLLLVSGFFALAVSPLSFEWLNIPTDVAERARASVAVPTTTPQMPSLAQRITDTIPVNPIKAAVDGALLPLIVFTLALAVAVTRLSADRRDALIRGFRAIADAMLVVVGWVLVVAPAGIFALIFVLGARMGASAAGAMLHYVVTLSLVMFAFTLLLYPFAIVLGRVSPRAFATALAPAQAVALTSRSSLAALPAMISEGRDRLGFTTPVTGFVLPFAVSVFRLNVPMAWVVGAIFLGKLYGIPVTGAQLAGLVITATLISFSVPGIPSSSLFLLTPVIVDLGLPAEGVGILIALDAIPDMFKTLANVTGHMTTAAVLDRYDRAPSPAPRELAVVIPSRAAAREP